MNIIEALVSGQLVFVLILAAIPTIVVAIVLIMPPKIRCGLVRRIEALLPFIPQRDSPDLRTSTRK